MKNFKLSIVALLFVMPVLFTPSFAQDADSDGDGVNDSEDLCVTVKGTKANKGCPEKTKQPEQTQKVTISEADLLKLQVGYVEEIAARDSKYKKLAEQYSTKASVKLRRENLLSRMSEMTAIKQIATKALANSKVSTSSKKFFTDRLNDAEYRLKLVNTLLELVALDEKDTNSGLGDDFLDKVITDLKPQVKTANIIKTAKELNPNNEGGNLFFAIKNGNNSLAESLFKSGVNLHYIENNADSTLTMTIRGGLLYYTKKLLEMGADPNFVGVDQHNPLQRAVIEGKLEIVKLLVEKYKADLNVIKFNWSILHYAATYNTSDEIAKFLIAAGANPNVTAPNGATPLSLALESRYSPSMIKLLTDASNDEIRASAKKRDETVGAENRRKDVEIMAEREREKRAKTPTELEVRVDIQSDFLNKGYKFVAEGTTTLQDRNSNDKNQAVKQDIFVGYEYIFIIVTNQEIKWVVTIGDDGKFTSSNKPQEGFGKEKVPNSDLTSYFFKFGFDDKSGYVYFIPHGDSWTDVRWVLMRKKI